MLIDAELCLEEQWDTGHEGILLVADPNQTVITESDPHFPCGISRSAPIAGKIQQWQAIVCSQLSQLARKNHKKLFSSVTGVSFCTCAGWCSPSACDGYAEIGTGVGFEFWSSPGKICVLSLWDSTVCTEWNQASVCVANLLVCRCQNCLPPPHCCSCGSCSGYTRSLNREAPGSCFCGCWYVFWKVVCVFCSGVLPWLLLGEWGTQHWGLLLKTFKHSACAME